MTDHQLIWEWNTRLLDIYKQENLTSIRGFGDEDGFYKHNGVNLYDKFVATTFRPEGAKLNFDPFEIIDELISISDQVMHFTAHTFLYGPLINNPLEDVQQPPGYLKPVYPNYQNLEAKRFDLYVDAVFEKIYGYWTRLAHLLNHYLPKPLKNHSVDFTRVIDQLPNQLPLLRDQECFQWLVNFAEHEHKVFNDQRRIIVHHKTTGTTFAQRHRDARTFEEVKVLMDERYGIPAFFKKQIDLTIVGYKMILDLISDSIANNEA